MTKELMKIIQRILKIKEERKETVKSKTEHYQKFRKLLGKEQELSRKLNEELEELEQFRLK